VRLKQAIDYSYINARIHGLISKLLSEEQMAAMDKTGSVTEVLHLLRNTEYSGLGDIYASTGDIKMVELELFQHHRGIFENLLKHSPEPLHPLIRAFSNTAEVYVIKESFRLWFDQSIRKRSISEFIAYIPDDISWNGVKPQQIVNADSEEELLRLVSRAGLDRRIPNAAEELREVFRTKSLFFLELAADRGYYELLRRESARLGRRDRKILASITGEEIDARNCTRFLRFPALFRNIPADSSDEEISDRVRRAVIPGGARFSPEHFIEAVKRAAAKGNFLTAKNASRQETRETEKMIDAGAEIISMISKSGYISLQPDMLTGQTGEQASADAAERQKNTARGSRQKERMNALIDIEQRLRTHILESARRFKRGDPFSIGTLAAFLILKEREIQKVQALINAKYYGLKLQETQHGQ